MLNISSLSFSYPRQHKEVLCNLNLEIGSGGIYGLLGANGVGKSTLLYLISGLLTPASGSVTLYGTETRRRLTATLEEIFLVPEEFVLPDVTLHAYIRHNAPFYPRFSNEDMKRHLEMFGLTSDLNLKELSMGQKKKAFMSFALACNTRLLLMDEPTNGLDIPGKSAFRRFILSSMNDERSILISTHQVNDIEQILDHVIIMNTDEIVLSAPTSVITSRMAFLDTAGNEIPSDTKILWEQPSVRGRAIITANPGGAMETEMNLETLFNLSQANPQILKSIFANNN